MAGKDEAYKWTDDKLEELEKRISKVYGQAAKDVQSTIDDYFEKFKKRDAAKLKELADGKITEQQYKQWRLAQMGRGERFEDLRDKLAERMTKANEVAAAYINDATPGIYSLNRNYAAYTIEQVAGDVGFTMWDEQTVKRLIKEQPDLMPFYPPQKAVERGIDLKYGKRQITNQVTSGILQGESIPKIAKRLQKNIPEMNRKNAVRAARTAATGAENGGRMDSYFAAEEMGIKIEKQWIATLDGRTRDSHADLDGKHVPNDEAFDNGLMYPGDSSGYASEVYNCRCTMIPYYPEYPSTGASRRARDPETGKNVLIEDMTYSEWTGWKSNKVQSVDDIMGEKISPVNILPVNQITDYDKFAALAYDFSHSGYSGRPIVAGELGDGTYQALTGSHRIFAAREANIDIPTVTLKYNDDTRELFEAIDDESRAEIVERLYKQGKIDKDVYRLMTYEDEANFTVSEEYAKAAKKKAELWQAEKEAKKKAEIDAQEAAKKASEKKREEFAKQRAESEDMKIYKAYYEAMKKKYGEEHMYRDMTSQEYDKIERLERIAYTGK